MMLLHSPELILLDEPTLGLDVVAKRQMIEFLKRIIQEEGVTILRLGFIQKFCCD